MLHLSNNTITLGKSADYVRAACLIHVFAVIVLLNSSFSLLMSMVLICVLFVSIVHIISSRIPSHRFTKLTQHTAYWALHSDSGEEIRYEQVCISFDGGLFILLTLIGTLASKKIVIFKDQLTHDQYRALSVVGKISFKKNKG